MPDQTDIITPTHAGYATPPGQNQPVGQPSAYVPNGQASYSFNPAGFEPTASRYSDYQAPARPGWKPYAIGALIAGLVLFIGYQQTEINRLSRDVGTLNNDMKTSDVPARLDAVDKKLDELNQRQGYLDSKITAVDQKAQTSLDKWREQESRGNIFTDIWKNVSKSLGLDH